jgi:prepilin-type N-terminal cleavage/methylation domain-containing protein
VEEPEVRKRGFTLLEVVIAVAILAIVLSTLYLLLFASTKMSQQEMAVRDMQFQLQLMTDRLSQEMRESSQPLIRTQDFVDPAMPTGNQTLVVMVSARDAGNTFMTGNAQPLWQKLVVYAPAWNAALNMGELRRYEVSPIPPEYLDVAFVPGIVVTAADIDLGSVTIARSGGERVLSNVDFFQADLNGNSFALNLSMQGGVLVDNRKVDMQSGTKGRN